MRFKSEKKVDRSSSENGWKYLDEIGIWGWGKGMKKLGFEFGLKKWMKILDEWSGWKK